MLVRIDKHTCYFKVDENRAELSVAATQLTVRTDSAKSMSFVELEGNRIYVTEAQADALTVAGVQDGRKHLKASDGDSVI